MIKKLFAALIVFSLLPFAGCEKDEFEGVSQLRTDIYIAEADGAEITVYSEEREIPLIADGAAGVRTKALIVKVVDTSAFTGTYTIKAAFDGREYSATPDLKGDTMLRAVIPVDELPSGSLDIFVSGEKEISATLHTALPEHAGASVALQTAKAALKGAMTEGRGEFFVRVLLEEGNAFWYIGYVTGDSTVSLLISGDGSNVIAEHTAGPNG